MSPFRTIGEEMTMHAENRRVWEDNKTLRAENERMRDALDELEFYFLPQTTRGPGSDYWVRAAGVYLATDPVGEYADEIRRLHALATDTGPGEGE